jgi:hypothetical protein
MVGRAFSPHKGSLAPETQADGLGCYGVAPSVLSFAAIRTSALPLNHRMGLLLKVPELRGFRTRVKTENSELSPAGTAECSPARSAGSATHVEKSRRDD